MTMEIGSALAVLLLGATPFFEARYAIPAAIVMGYPPASAFALGIPGNILPVVTLLLLLEPVSQGLSARSARMADFFGWIFARTRTNEDSVTPWGALTLFLFVMVPLPLTVSWSGCVIAFVLGIPFRQAFPAILAGAIVAAPITTLPRMGIRDQFGG